MKEKEIILPEGFEIDFEKSTKEKIILKAVKEKKLPEKVEDLGEYNMYSINGAYLFDEYKPGDVYGFVSKKAVKSAEAKRLLGFLLKEYNGDWEPDWENEGVKKYVLTRIENEIKSFTHYGAYKFLAFRTPELRDKFLSHFERLIKDYFELD